MNILTILLILPLLGVLFIGATSKIEGLAKFIALGFSVVTFLGSVAILTMYDVTDPDFQLVEYIRWFPTFGVNYHLGIDGLSLPLYLLSTLLIMLVMLFSWNVHHRPALYFSLILVLETGVLGVFSSLDLFLFYIFWEVVLIPMFFLIGIWGGERRSYASMKFLIYTHVASLIMLLCIGAMFFKAAPLLGYYSFSIPAITSVRFDLPFQMMVFPFLLFAFCVKLPVVPFHTWLPDAHVEAPTGGSVLLAGALLKMGGYGLIRIAYTMNPLAAEVFTPLVVTLAIISIVYGAYTALKQEDLKKMIAYSSISHMGFVLIGIATFSTYGVSGALFQMVAHGLISPILFMACGVIQHNAGTRDISKLGGLYYQTPKLMTIFILTSFASMGIPGFMGFVAEFAVMMGVIEAFGAVVLFVALGAVLTVAYYLWAFQRVALGSVPKELQFMKDVAWFEAVPMCILLVMTVYFGINPDPLLNFLELPTEAILALVGK